MATAAIYHLARLEDTIIYHLCTIAWLFLSPSRDGGGISIWRMLHIKPARFPFPCRASSPPPVTARARQSGESVWRRGLFSCTLTAAAVEGYRRACPRFAKASRYRRRRSPNRDTLFVVTLRITLRTELFPSPPPGKSAHRYLTPAVLPRSPNRLWVAIFRCLPFSSVFFFFFFPQESILSSVCIVCCAIVWSSLASAASLVPSSSVTIRANITPHSRCNATCSRWTGDVAERRGCHVASRATPSRWNVSLCFLFPGLSLRLRLLGVRWHVPPRSVCVCVCVCRARGHRVRFDPAPLSFFFPAPR